MKFLRVSLDRCHEITGVAIVIDVLRAFTTAAFAFSKGVKDITLVSSVDEAFELRECYPDMLIMGEVDGLPVEGFDFGNSPTQISARDLSGIRIIQRTTAGTQGVIGCVNAELILAAGLCNAAATADYIRSSTESICFVVTELRPGGWGGEDLACADYIEGLLKNNPEDILDIQTKVKSSLAAEKFLDSHQTEFPDSDLEYALEINRFDFVMKVTASRDGFPVLTAVCHSK